MENISKITLPNDTTYDIKDKNARNFTNTPYYKQDEEALMFQLGESYMTEVQDNQPYLFRAAGGSANIGNREYDKIIGGTVCWNQKVNTASGFFISNVLSARVTANNDNGYSVKKTSNVGNLSGVSSGLSNGHVYLVTGRIKSSSASFFSFIGTRKANTTYTAANARKYVKTNSTDYVDFAILDKGDSTYSRLGVWQDAGAATNLTTELGDFCSFDLTQMFGAAIADYILALETATFGVGVAFFRKLFPKSYYPYSTNTLLSVKALSHDMVGFNAYDNTTGQAKVVGGNVYQITGAYTALSLDGETVTPDADGYFTPSNSGILTVTGGNATTTCVHLKWDGEKDGEWEPYVKHSYALDPDLELRGILMLDANNRLYYDGDTYESNGTVTRKFGIIDLGTLSWTYNSSAMVFWSTINAQKLGSGKVNIICDRYITSTSARVEDVPTGYIWNRANAYSPKNIVIKDTAYSDAVTFKSAMSGAYLVYERATPTTEQAEPYDNPQIVAPEGTEEYITTSIIPVGHETRY